MPPHTPLPQGGITPQNLRRIILVQSKRAGVGHIGCSLSVVEIIAALYGGVLRIASPADPDRDRFVLSKGHAGLALQAALALRGWIPAEQLDSYCGDNSQMGVHPEPVLPGVDFATGSLGMGLSFAAGAALAARLQGSSRRVFCLLSDAECNEGSTWEAAMFAAHQELSNLCAIVDWDGQQAFGLTRDVMNCSNLLERWQAFGWHAAEVDGHSLADLKGAMAPCGSHAPQIVLAKTVFGKGVSYMEKGIPLSQTHLSVQPFNWHYLPMSDHEYRIAMEEIEGGG
jgi:transketolase